MLSQKLFDTEILRLMVALTWQPEPAFVKQLKEVCKPLTDEQFQIVCEKVQASETRFTITIPVWKKFIALMVNEPITENPEYCEFCLSVGMITYRYRHDPSHAEYSCPCPQCPKGAKIIALWLTNIDPITGKPAPIKVKPWNPRTMTRSTDPCFYTPLPEDFKSPQNAEEVKAYFALMREKMRLLGNAPSRRLATAEAMV